MTDAEMHFRGGCSNFRHFTCGWVCTFCLANYELNSYDFNCKLFLVHVWNLCKDFRHPYVTGFISDVLT